ncbi:MAG: SufE family protein [Pseudomonadales bacterium]|nr:SufE family protein [Pseudomonadales bacterium]
MENLEEIVDTFEFLDDWEDKYRFVIDAGKSVPTMPEESRTESNLVRGCQSQVWMTTTLNADDTLHLNLDSDAHIVRGLISIVLAAYNDKSPNAILEFDIEALFSRLALLEHLSQTRGNGLRAMIQRIREVATRSL